MLDFKQFCMPTLQESALKIFQICFKYLSILNNFNRGNKLATFQVTSVRSCFHHCGFAGSLLRIAWPSSDSKHKGIILLDQESCILLQKKNYEDRALRILQDHIQDKRPKLSELWKYENSKPTSGKIRSMTLSLNTKTSF